MALLSGPQIAVVILLALLLIALTIGKFAYIIRLGETDGDEKWKTPPIDEESEWQYDEREE